MSRRNKNNEKVVYDNGKILIIRNGEIIYDTGRVQQVLELGLKEDDKK